MSTAEPEVELPTPEGVVLRLPLASISERAMAFLFDLALQGVALLILVVAGLFLSIAGLMSGTALPIAIFLAAFFVLRTFYFTAFELFLRGRTLGKMAFGLRVISQSGEGLGLEAILARNLMREAEWLLPMQIVLMPESVIPSGAWWTRLIAVAWAVLFPLTPLLNPLRQRAGDLIAGTLVIRMPRAQLLTDAAVIAKTRFEVARFEAQHLAVYGEHELEVLASLIREINTGRTDPEAVRTIALTIAKKIGYDGNDARDRPQEFLGRFYRAQRAELEKRLLLGDRKASKWDVD